MAVHSITVKKLISRVRQVFPDAPEKYIINLINDALVEIGTHKVKVVAPFSQLSKLQEINICKEMNKTDIFENTITCYNPIGNKSCGKCPSCSERIANFIKAGIKDPIPYAVDIKWENFICVQ